MTLNKVLLIGNVGKKPDVRSTQDGRSIVTFSVATSERWKDKSTGEMREKTEWHRVVILSDGLAKIVEKYVDKGSKLYIEGTLQTRKWTDNNNIEKYTTEIVLQGYNNKLEILDSRGGGEKKEIDGYSDNSFGSSENVGHFSSAVEDDDVPF